LLEAMQGTNTTGLWQSNGTAAGTMLLRGLPPDAVDGLLFPIAKLGRQLIFADGDGELMSVRVPPLPATAREPVRLGQWAKIEAIHERRMRRLEEAWARWIARIEAHRAHRPSGM
jgi:ELWxxDGT repeat protein